jgi:Leucine-rich repeat (LRR) protein
MARPFLHVVTLIISAVFLPAVSALGQNPDAAAERSVHYDLGYYEDLNLALQQKENVRHLNLMYKGLKDFPAAILQFKNLENLDLAHNELTSIPEEIVSLPSLKFLYLNDNKLSDLPESLRTMKQLRILFIQMNPVNTDSTMLEKIPPGLERLESGNPPDGDVRPAGKFSMTPPKE